MSTPYEGYIEQFAAQHPEAGGVARGAVLTAETALAFGSIMHGRVMELSRQLEPLGDEEAAFVNGLADVGSRCVQYVLERGAAVPVSDPDYTNAAFAAYKALPPSAKRHADTGRVYSREDFASWGPATAYALGAVTGGDYSMRHAPELRAKVEDLAANVVLMFGRIAAYNAEQGHPIVVDPYLGSKLQELVWSYERIAPPENDSPALTQP